jgi:hypothetical protein
MPASVPSAAPSAGSSGPCSAATIDIEVSRYSDSGAMVRRPHNGQARKRRPEVPSARPPWPSPLLQVREDHPHGRRTPHRVPSRPDVPQGMRAEGERMRPGHPSTATS